MSTQQERELVWRHLSSTYQQLNATSNTAERKRLQFMAEMLRKDYRHLTSTYQ